MSSNVSFLSDISNMPETSGLSCCLFLDDNPFCVCVILQDLFILFVIPFGGSLR